MCSKRSDTTPPTAAGRTRHVVLFGLSAAIAIAYIDRGCIQIVVTPLRADLRLGDDALGLVMSAFFLSYALLQLPVGWLCQVWGPRRSLPVFAAAWSAAMGLTAAAGSLTDLVIVRAALGAFEAGVLPAAIAAVAQWYPASRRAWASGVLGAAMGVGGALGTVLTGLLLNEISWRGVFVAYALPGFVWAAWFHYWYRDRPEDHPSVGTDELAVIRAGDRAADDIKAAPASAPASAPAPGLAPGPTPWRAIFGSATLWWLNGQQFFRAAGSVFFMSWFPTYLQETRGVSLEEAGALASLPHLSILVGTLAGGVIADRILARTGSRTLSRKGLAVASLVGCAVLTGVSFLIADAAAAAVVISAGTFCSGLAGPCAYAATLDLGGRHVAPVFSLMNAAGNAGAILFPVAAPRLVALTGSWDLALSAFIGLFAAAALCWLPVRLDRPLATGANPG